MRDDRRPVIAGDIAFLVEIFLAGWESVDHKTSIANAPVPVEQGHLSGLTGDASGTVWASGVDLAHPEQVLFLRCTVGEWAVSYSSSLPIPDQSEDAWNRVTRTSITRVPGANTLWAVASTGADAREKGFILRRN